MATLAGELELSRRHGAFRAPIPAAKGGIVDADEAGELVPPIYERVAAATPSFEL